MCASVHVCKRARVHALLTRMHALTRKQPAHTLTHPPPPPGPHPPFLHNLLPEEHFETDTRRMQNTLIALRGGRRWGGEGVRENRG